MKNKLTEQKGVVVRVAGASLAYLRSLSDGTTYSFGPGAIQNVRCDSFNAIDLAAESDVKFSLDTKLNIVTAVHLIIKKTQDRSARKPACSVSGQATPRNTSAKSLHIELDPASEAMGSIKPNGAIAPLTRAFGKMIDTAMLSPGDLLLSRPVQPNDFISKTITEVQAKGGYAPSDAKWTHAAMYLGDGTNVVEASFDSVLGGGDVRITNLNEYATGEYYLRFRRSKAISDVTTGWLLCVRGLAQLKKPYDFAFAAKMWFDVVIRGGGFFQSRRMAATSQAVVCSTFYADAYNEATRSSLGEVNGSCVPAWLSQCKEFDDIKTKWLEIEK